MNLDNYYAIHEISDALGIENRLLKNRCAKNKAPGLNFIYYKEIFLFPKENFIGYLSGIAGYLNISPSEIVPVKNVLKKMCYTQKELAYILGVAESTICLWNKTQKVKLPKSLHFMSVNFYLRAKVERFMSQLKKEHQRKTELLYA